MSEARTRHQILTARRVGCLLLTIPFLLVCVFVLFISVLSPPIPPPNPFQALPADFMKGVSYESWSTGEFASANSDQTLTEIILPSGANWVSVIVKCYQATLTATEISCETYRSASDEELRHVIREAHNLGLQVMLKPHLDPLDMQNSSSGRFMIGFGADEAAWAAWFSSYTRVMTHYAVLAQELGVEYLAIGTELAGTVRRVDEWRTLIRAVREIYSGRLTYAALAYFEPPQIVWWDDLDAIGIDAYFTVTLTNQPTLAQMRLGWLPATIFLSWLAAYWDKPIIITEVGYMSADGTNVLPGDWSTRGGIDLQEQADAYQALFESFRGHDWWHGVFMWSLSTNPDQGGAADRGYSFHDKPAEAVLRRFFGAD